MKCHACGAALSPTARFCHKCGAAVGAAQAAGWRAGLPWAVAGAALGALVMALVLRLGASAGGGTRETAGGEEAAPPASRVTPPDISQMSPEERATRLYNRVMMLHAAGKTDSAQFFLPMALQAYAMLPTLDIDARYHVGVLELAGGEAGAALAQADSIRRLAPTHLFGFMLRARALETRKNPGAAQQAYRDFLKNERAERARQRPEYAEHAQNLDAFHTQALEATTGNKKAGA